MVNGKFALVLIDQGESGTANVGSLVQFQTVTDSLGKAGFACTEIPKQKDDVTGTQRDAE